MSAAAEIGCDPSQVRRLFRAGTLGGIACRLLGESITHAEAMGMAIVETWPRGGEPAEEVYRRLGFREWGQLPGGQSQPWGRVRTFDEVHFYLPIAGPAGGARA